MRLHPHFIIQSTEEDLTKKKRTCRKDTCLKTPEKGKNDLKLSASELLLNPFNVNPILFLCLYACLFIQDGTL